jgi:hypothetical protein
MRKHHGKLGVGSQMGFIPPPSADERIVLVDVGREEPIAKGTSPVGSLLNPAATSMKRSDQTLTILFWHCENGENLRTRPSHGSRKVPTTKSSLTSNCSEEHRDQFSVISGLSYPEQNGANGHTSELAALTSVKHPGMPGVKNGISIEQYLANKL